MGVSVEFEVAIARMVAAFRSVYRKAYIHVYAFSSIYYKLRCDRFHLDLSRPLSGVCNNRVAVFAFFSSRKEAWDH